jgi:hypothetical protein
MPQSIPIILGTFNTHFYYMASITSGEMVDCDCPKSTFSNPLGVKKYLWFRLPTDPIIFSADPIIFFNAIDRATLFSSGGCGLLPKWRLLSH